MPTETFSFKKDLKSNILHLVSKLLECLETSLVYNGSKMLKENMVINAQIPITKEDILRFHCC